VAKDARQFEEQNGDDAPTGADSQVAATPHDVTDATPDDADSKARRGRKPKPAIEPSDLQGLKYFDKLKPLLARLHEVGTERVLLEIATSTWMNTVSLCCSGCSVPC